MPAIRATYYTPLIGDKNMPPQSPIRIRGDESAANKKQASHYSYPAHKISSIFLI